MFFDKILDALRVENLFSNNEIIYDDSDSDQNTRLANPMSPSLESQKNKTTALLLCIFGGYLGIHQFYTKHIVKGILYCLTLGFLGIGWIIDIFLIITDHFYDNQGLPLHHSVYDTDTVLPTEQQQNTTCSSYSEQIIQFWMNQPLFPSKFTYRNASMKEQQDFALISILSAFDQSARRLDSFSDLILSELGISNRNSYMRMLLHKEYICRANIAEYMNAIYTLEDLKVIADSVGVPKKGKKHELIQRIIPEMDNDKKQQIFDSDLLYTISATGMRVLHSNDDYILYYKYRHQVSLAEFNDFRYIGNIKRNAYDTLFQCLTQQSFIYACKKDYEQKALTELNIYHLLLDEQKHTSHNISGDIPLMHYIEFLYIRTCLCHTVKIAVKEGIFPSLHANILLPQPDKELYHLADYEDTIDYNYIVGLNPPSLLLPDEFKTYIHEMLTGPMFDNQKWSRLIQDKLQIIISTLAR
nr:MAG TPA: TM2 domain [Caudoviricetes sp.]